MAETRLVMISDWMVKNDYMSVHLGTDRFGPVVSCPTSSYLRIVEDTGTF